MKNKQTLYCQMDVSNHKLNDNSYMEGKEVNVYKTNSLHNEVRSSIQSFFSSFIGNNIQMRFFYFE